jgi:hypothetical protein
MLLIAIEPSWFDSRRLRYFNREERKRGLTRAAAIPGDARCAEPRRYLRSSLLNHITLDGEADRQGTLAVHSEGLFFSSEIDVPLY